MGWQGGGSLLVKISQIKMFVDVSKVFIEQITEDDFI